MSSIPILVLLLLTLAIPAFASDGVLEINQTCAVQTGCFAGDTAGLPVAISASGSYRLTSNLVVPDENTDGIVVSTDNVGIDLNNFEIRGPVVCSGTPLACVPELGGTGAGVRGVSSRGLSIANGSIRGMGFYGVTLGVRSKVMDLRVGSNLAIGISTLSGSTIAGNTVYQNGTEGIFAGAGSTVSGNTAYQNGGYGLVAGAGSTVFGNTAFQNGVGISSSSGSTVSGNTAYENRGDGIQVSGGSTISGNTIRSNTGVGLSLGSESGYRENVISSNTLATVLGGINAGDNVCNGLLTCP